MSPLIRDTASDGFAVFIIPFRKKKMAESIKTKLENYKTAPFDSRFPNQNQTRNCWQNYLGEFS